TPPAEPPRPGAPAPAVAATRTPGDSGSASLAPPTLPAGTPGSRPEPYRMRIAPPARPAGRRSPPVRWTFRPPRHRERDAAAATRARPPRSADPRRARPRAVGCPRSRNVDAHLAPGRRDRKSVV